MSVRLSFVARFGEDQAARIEEAASYHEGRHTKNRGSDPFKWAFLIAIGWECISHERFREWHKITASLEEMRKWALECGDLGSHDGDFDYLAALAGNYKGWWPEAAGGE